VVGETTVDVLCLANVVASGGLTLKDVAVKTHSVIWWSRWDCKSAIEENRRKTAKFPSLLPLTDFSNAP
jgi:hypothetical protein